MKKLMLGLAAAAMLASAGCGKGQTTVTTPTDTGTVTVDQGNKQVTVTGPSGTVQVDQGGTQVTVTAPSSTVSVSTDTTTDVEKTFGVPPYPGAAQQMSVQGQNATDSGSVAILTTSDPFDKVVAFYKDRFPSANATVMNAGVMKNATIVIEDKGKTLAVNITEQGGRTTIQIASSDRSGGGKDDEPSTDDTMAPGSSPEPGESP